MKVKRVLRWVGGLLTGLLLIVILGALAVWGVLRGSLAALDGRRSLPGLGHPVRVERDALGVPALQATNRLDLSRALGFIHAQERFFQMDLNRRAGAGELSDLVGAIGLASDREQRIHRPRSRAQKAMQAMSTDDRTMLQAYSDGVNAGLAALTVRPPEYLALRISPAPWRPEDIILVGYAMFGDLHDITGRDDYRQFVLHQALSPAALAFFNSPDITWSAALDDSWMPSPPIPGPQDFQAVDDSQQARLDTPQVEVEPELSEAQIGEHRPNERGARGSNNWAVRGTRTATGSAIVANDMHLGLMVPNTWFRARLIYQDPTLGRQDVTGVTLPGTPVVVSGANGHIAWGNTFSCLDVTDLVVLEFDPADPKRYQTPSGWRNLESYTETIAVRGGTNILMTVQETIWGPVVTKGGRRYALACTMHEPDAINMGLLQLERARDVESALHLANLAGAPVNNFVVGDKSGNIGYSFLGRLPRRVGFDGSVPCSWADGTKGWQGWLPEENYPRVINPAKGVLWTANNRTLGSPQYLALHVSDPDNGARAGLIRDDLLALDRASEQSVWAIYRNDRGRFLERWQRLLLETLERGALTNREWAEARDYVKAWGNRAAIDSQGYRLVRGFRTYALNLLCEPLNRQIAKFDKAMKIQPEDAAFAMLKQRPPHLLNPADKSYDLLLEKAVSLVLGDLKGRGIPLARATWGQRNRLGIRHPLSLAVPALSRWLDMPDVAVSGDHQMPKVHNPGGGVSERMVVSPGHEENGLFNMPCGQSGHFLSRFYRSEMEAWLQVKPQPFLPGPPRYRLDLLPAAPAQEGK